MSADIIPFPNKREARLERFAEILGDQEMVYSLLIRLVEELPPESREEFCQKMYRAAMKAANKPRKERKDERLDY